MSLTATCEDPRIAVPSIEGWSQFLDFVRKRCSATAFNNWLEPIKVIESSSPGIVLEVPNIFVKEYLLANYKKDLCAFLPVHPDGEPAITFLVAALPKKEAEPQFNNTNAPIKEEDDSWLKRDAKFNSHYSFSTFIEGTSNQFVKSAAIGVASRPGNTYNPLFIHGPVGLGKTHLLHSIGHHVRCQQKKVRVQCITTEAFINELVDCLRNKSIDRMKRFYRSDIDVLLVDDIQFLQNRQNFEEEFCHTFETLINQNKQIVITSDKPPAQLKLSERMVARMEWGLVAHIGVPDLETRVAIIQNKSQQKGVSISNDVAFFIAEHIYSNVRQLEGAINRLSAHSRLLEVPITEDLVATILKEIMQHTPHQKVSIEQILKSVATVFQVRVSDIKGQGRTKEIALPRQVAMYLACKLLKESLQVLGAYFGRTHSTLLHASKTITKRLSSDDILRRQVGMVERDIHV